MRSARLVPALAALMLAVTACGGPSGSQLAALQAMSENSLARPGSTTLATYATEANVTVDGPVYASSGHLYGTSASQGDVVSFYNHALSTTGWLPTNLTAQRGTIETAAVAWSKNSIVLRLGFQARGTDPRLPSPAIQDAYQTIYRVDLIDHSTGTPT